MRFDSCVSREITGIWPPTIPVNSTRFAPAVAGEFQPELLTTIPEASIGSTARHALGVRHAEIGSAVIPRRHPEAPGDPSASLIAFAHLQKRAASGPTGCRKLPGPLSTIFEHLPLPPPMAGTVSSGRREHRGEAAVAG